MSMYCSENHSDPYFRDSGKVVCDIARVDMDF